MSKIDIHKHNANILSSIYITCSVIGIVLSTVCSLLLGSKSISDIRDTTALIAFLFNVIATVMVAVVNFLQLETKIHQHISTAKQLQDLEWEKKSLTQELYLEKLKMINDNAPQICFDSECCKCFKDPYDSSEEDTDVKMD